MKSITQTNGLGDIRTVISTHTRSVPRHKGSVYLDILSLGMEKLRLETELAWLARRQGRIEGRLGEIRDSLKDMVGRVPQGGPAGQSSPAPLLSQAAERSATPRGWRKMAIEY